MEEMLKDFIQEIDNQLSNLSLDSPTLEKEASSLLYLRNSVLQKYKLKNPKDWVIKNPKVKKILSSIQWTTVWV